MFFNEVLKQWCEKFLGKKCCYFWKIETGTIPANYQLAGNTLLHNINFGQLSKNHLATISKTTKNSQKLLRPFSQNIGTYPEVKPDTIPELSLIQLTCI